MSFMDRPTDELKDKLIAALEKGVSAEGLTRLKKSVVDIMTEVETDIEYRLKEDLAPNLAAWVVDMANKTVKSMLAGNQDEVRRYLSCEGYYTGRGREHELNYHGNLFEPSCIELRRKIVEAHRDVITDERILDLEAQLASLVKQNKVLIANKHRLEEELRNWRR